MKPAVILATVFSMCACVCSAQTFAGKISLYSDSLHTSREAADTTTGVLNVYVVHDGSALPGVAIQFRVVSGGGFTGVWVSESTPYAVFIGTSFDGIAIGFGTCVSQPNLVLRITYTLFGTSSECSFLRVVPDPSNPAGQIELIPCAGQSLVLDDGQLDVNPKNSCGAVQTEVSTWGRVKSLYQ